MTPVCISNASTPCEIGTSSPLKYRTMSSSSPKRGATFFWTLSYTGRTALLQTRCGAVCLCSLCPLRSLRVELPRRFSCTTQAASLPQARAATMLPVAAWLQDAQSLPALKMQCTWHVACWPSPRSCGKWACAFTRRLRKASGYLIILTGPRKRLLVHD